MFPGNKTGKCFFHHREIPLRNSICTVTAWPFMRSKNCVSFFFQEDTSGKFLILCYLICLSFDCKYHLHLLLFSLIVVAFPACTCEPVHIQHSFEFLCMLSGLGWVGFAQKISARCNTGSYVFSFFFICIFILLLALSHIYVFLFPQRVPSDLEVGYEKSILTRTETLFYHYLFQRTPVIYNFISQDNVFLFAIYFH